MRAVEGNGRTLIPGLIEMHTHLSLPAWGSRHGKVWLAYGITSMRTPADSPYRVLEERESILSNRRVGPRVFFTGGTIDGDRIYYTGAHAIGDVEELAQEMQRAFDLQYDLIKTYVRLPDPLQKLVIEEAHRQGFYVTSHELYPAVAYGVDGIEHVAGTSRRGFSPKLTALRQSYDDVIELVARSGVYYTPTVLIYGGFSLARAREPNLLLDDARFVALFPPWSRNRFLSASPPGDVDASLAAMAPIFSTVDALGARGARIIAGTDSPSFLTPSACSSRSSSFPTQDSAPSRRYVARPDGRPRPWALMTRLGRWRRARSPTSCFSRAIRPKTSRI